VVKPPTSADLLRLSVPRRRSVRHLLLAGTLLFALGCAGVDDREEQSEFEKLRKYPRPRGDRLLPSFERDSGGGGAQRDA
jgi:hypothetical protein